MSTAKPKHLLVSSEFRNRQLYPRSDAWVLNLDSQGSDKASSIDPVCLACPVLTWRQFSTAMVSLTNSRQILEGQRTRLSVSASEFATAEAALEDFYIGTNFVTPLATYRVLSSTKVAPTTQLITIAGVPDQAEYAGPLLLQDTWIPTQNWIRAPTRLDLSKLPVLYNQTRQLGVRVLECTADRRLVLEVPVQTWAVTDTIGLRGEAPASPVYTVVGSGTSVVLLDRPLARENIGDWLRVLSVGLLESQVPKARIIGLQGMGVLVYPTLPVAVGDQVELLRYTYDNANSLSLRAARGTPVKLRLKSFQLHSPERPRCLRLGLSTLNDTQPAIFDNNPLGGPRSTWILEYDEAKDHYNIMAGAETTVSAETSTPLQITLSTLSGQVHTRLQDTEAPAPALHEANYTLLLEML
jgi:hypothetical protein